MVGASASCPRLPGLIIFPWSESPPKWWVKGNQAPFLTLITPRNRRNNEPCLRQQCPATMAKVEADLCPLTLQDGAGSSGIGLLCGTVWSFWWARTNEHGSFGQVCLLLLGVMVAGNLALRTISVVLRRACFEVIK